VPASPQNGRAAPVISRFMVAATWKPVVGVVGLVDDPRAQELP
jgi:hypothetical protein